MRRSRFGRGRARATRRADRESEPRDAQPQIPLPSRLFEVLCRIDAYADYVAEVDAGSAKEAAERASNNHGNFKWRPRGVAEFDARLYVTLDQEGCEIEESEVRDF